VSKKEGEKIHLKKKKGKARGECMIGEDLYR